MKANIGGYEFDTATPTEVRREVQEVFGHYFSNFQREAVRGIKPIKLPIVTATATGTTLNIPVANGPEPVACGPQQGYFWRIGRVTVSSNGTDNGAVSLYSGSDPFTFSQSFLIDNTLKVGQAYYPGSRGCFLWPGEQLYASLAASVSGNTYRIAGIAIEVPAEMAGKILG